MYCIKASYISRDEIHYYNDTHCTDEWQNEVYEYAKRICENNNYTSIVDFGCGSGYKLIKYFSDYNTIGIDLPDTVKFLKQKYPDKYWTHDTDEINPVDVFIAADVIEHMKDPDVLIDIIKRIKPKEIIISTPDRNLTVKKWGYTPDGPPNNIYHVREWSFDEFNKYIGLNFDIQHHFISNMQQCTQLIHARIRNGR